MIKLTKHNSFADSLFPSFPNFTEAMYEGNKPAGKGHEHIEGGYCDRWSCKWGGGESYKGRLLNADFKPNYKITIYICGDVLWITDLRHSGKTDVWEYSSDPERLHMTNVNPSRIHELEREKIEELLDMDIDCEFWRIVQLRAKEIYVSNN